VRISQDGAVAVEDASLTGPDFIPTPVVVAGTAVPDPAMLVQVTPGTRFDDPGTPIASREIPAGTIPAGWRVLGAKPSGDGRHVAVLTVPEREPTPSQLSVYELKDGRLAERWREMNEFVDVDWELALRDLNGDGQPDVVYTTMDGGNGWIRRPTLMASIRPEGDVADVTFELPISLSSPKGPVDLDGDGVYEWTALDASWELKGFCHACSPGSSFVLEWDGDAYVDATPRFADEVIGRRDDPVQPPADAPCNDKETYLSQGVSRALDYANAGQGDELRRMIEVLRLYEPIGELRAKRDAIVAALEQDPHTGYLPDTYLNDCPFDS
jgi:hypothetical protein